MWNPFRFILGLFVGVLQVKCYLMVFFSPNSTAFSISSFLPSVYVQHSSVSGAHTVPMCVDIHMCHHCGNFPKFHECFLLFCALIHSGERWHHCNKNMQTDPPNSIPSVNLCASMRVFLCRLDSTASVSSLFSLTRCGNKPSFFLMIYPCRVLDEPPGMPLQRFVLFDGLAGWKRQARFGKGRYRPERNDGKGLE